MKLEDFDRLDKERTPGPWGTLAHVYPAEGIWYAHTPETKSKSESEANASFIAACSEMVPRLIDAAMASWHLVRALDDGRSILAGSALHKMLRVTLADLEQP